MSKSVLTILMLLILTAGCSQQPAQAPVTTAPVEAITTIAVSEEPVSVTVRRIDAEKILVTYLGGPDADQLIELETTVVNSKGSVKTQSMGSRLDTTPVQIGGTEIFLGPYPEKAHVMITGYYANGTHRDILDTRA